MPSFRGSCLACQSPRCGSAGRLVNRTVATHFLFVPADSPGVSVVIPVLNERESLARALGSIDLPGIERIVVDGGSSDGSPELARKLGADLVLDSAPGRALQIELGRRRASGEVILFLHADTRLEAGWLESLRAALHDPGVAGGAFSLRFESPRLALRVIEVAVAWRCRLARLPYGDQALFVRSQVLERVGGIPPVPLFEDLDLVRTIRRSGKLALLASGALTSPRRYERNGVWRTVLRNLLAVAAWWLGLPRDRVSIWYRRAPAR